MFNFLFSNKSKTKTSVSRLFSSVTLVMRLDKLLKFSCESRLKDKSLYEAGKSEVLWYFFSKISKFSIDISKLKTGVLTFDSTKFLANLPILPICAPLN